MFKQYIGHLHCYFDYMLVCYTVCYKEKSMSQRKRRSPKYENALAEFRMRVEDGGYPYGELLPPERELAEELGINRQTLRKVLEALNQVNLLEHESGRGHRVVYELLKPVSISKEKIAVVFYRPADYIQIDGYYGPIFSGIAQEAEIHHNWLTQLLSAQRPIEEIADIVKSENIQGIVALGIMKPDVLLKLHSLDIPLVCVDYDTQTLGIDSIVENDFISARRACQLLTQLGHRHIGYIGMIRGSETIGFHEEASSALRQQGYIAALNDAGIERYNVCVGSSGIEGGIAGFNELYSKNPQLTAIFCFQDVIAAGVMRAAREKGLRIPEDFSVIGYGDDRQVNTLIELPLTTIRSGSPKEIASSALSCLCKRMRRSDRPAIRHILDCELIVRQSTAQCPSQTIA